MGIPFTKMHGLGNDYHFIDCTTRTIPDPAELSRQMSHRHLGVGSDGIILVLPGDSGGDFRMRIFNADGSEAETCGNGLRCFAKYVYERGMTDKTEITVETLAGPNRLEMQVEDGKVVSVRSNMGQPRFNRNEIPMRGEDEGPVKEHPLDLGDEVVRITCANIGNPHAVIFVEDATAVDLRHYGPLVENHPEFPQRTNVELVNVIDRENIVMRIWERGSGITMASGSGSCGAALACMITDRTARKVQVHLVYGTLTIEWAEDGNVYQQGPATEVFSGEWPEESVIPAQAGI